MKLYKAPNNNTNPVNQYNPANRVQIRRPTNEKCPRAYAMRHFK
jgi:hypothetical protein